ncbi:MAG: PA0069 family radical SAM protein [Gammaproteobacteria bacterium]|nr:PA0069 family radical SAM protein [Gammaproteobacteria bacterium]
MKNQHCHTSTEAAHSPPVRPASGRGTWRKPPGRFASTSTVRVADGWFLDMADLPQARVPTTIHVEHARSIISRNQSPDVPFEQSINPYRGCEHGCIYCYARPSHAFVDLSPGLDFETRIFAKKNAAKLLAKEITASGYQCTPINLGANTDPYQPAEKKHKITRSILQVLARHRHPVTIITKGALVLRDLDILTDMAADNLVSVAVSITTLKNDLKRIMEPRAASVQARLTTISTLSENGIPTTLLLAPVIPAINDSEIEHIVHASADAGVCSAHYIFLRLPFEVKELFVDWLQEYFPLRARHVTNLLRAARNGKLNDPRFGNRMQGEGPYAEMIGKRFARAVRECGLSVREESPLNTAAFKAQHPASAQLSLL